MLVAIGLLVVALLSRLFFFAYPAAILLFVIGPRVAYNHRGVGDNSSPEGDVSIRLRS